MTTWYPIQCWVTSHALFVETPLVIVFALLAVTALFLSLIALAWLELAFHRLGLKEFEASTAFDIAVKSKAWTSKGRANLDVTTLCRASYYLLILLLMYGGLVLGIICFFHSVFFG